ADRRSEPSRPGAGVRRRGSVLPAAAAMATVVLPGLFPVLVVVPVEMTAIHPALAVAGARHVDAFGNHDHARMMMVVVIRRRGRIVRRAAPDEAGDADGNAD